ncbi:MAG: D-2-hydroxyacid dehydrogenase [Pseudomonadota bacterium]
MTLRNLLKIVVLDGYTLNPGDLSWEKFQSLGECTVYDRSAPHEVVSRAADANVVLTNKTVLDRAIVSSLPALQYIGVLATGYNVVDMACARERGITVTNVPGYSTQSVVQMVFALILELTNRVGEHTLAVRQGKWSASPDFCYWEFPIVELNGLTIGVVGFGNIGKAVAKLAQAFGMQVLVHTRTVPVERPSGIEFCSLERIFRDSDIVTLHCPLTEQTERMVNAKVLALMKPSVYLINTSRGPLVDEAELADALNKGQIAGAAVDVLAQEPPLPGYPLLKAKNCYITPHIAWASKAARSRLIEIAFENLCAFLNGERKNVVTLGKMKGDILYCSCQDKSE